MKIIEEKTFFDCPSIGAITVEEDNPFYYCDGTCLVERQSKKIIFGFSESIPTSSDVTAIGASAFLSCKKLFKIEIPSNIASIGQDAFAACGRLIEVKIQNGCREISKEAFRFCHNLKRVSVPESVTDIGENAFGDCENLTLCAPSGSCAERYAKEQNIPFVSQEVIENDWKILSGNKHYLLPIEALRLSARSTNQLIRHDGICTVRELVSLQEKQVQKIKGIDKNSFKEIKERLEEIGLFFSKW